jgi:hypothetical protein
MWISMERVVQGTNHHVDHLGVAHAGTPTHVQRGEGRAAHVLGTAANGDIGVAQQNALAGRHNGLQARAAQAVDIEGRHLRSSHR